MQGKANAGLGPKRRAIHPRGSLGIPMQVYNRVSAALYRTNPPPLHPCTPVPLCPPEPSGFRPSTLLSSLRGQQGLGRLLEDCSHGAVHYRPAKVWGWGWVG